MALIFTFQNCSRPASIKVTEQSSVNNQSTTPPTGDNNQPLTPQNPLNNPTTPSINPIGKELSKAIAFNKVEFSNNHSCGISTDNRTYCWGQDNYGELGNGPGIQSTNVPVEVNFPSKEYSLDVQVSL